MQLVLVICPLESIEVEPMIFGGVDAYDHFAMLIKDGSLALTIPATNVDPSRTSTYPRLAHGYYRVVKGIHRWKTGKKEMPGFFVCKHESFPESFPWKKIHGHSCRVDLPGFNSLGVPTPASYINIHEGGEGKWSSDWSDGCITMPGRFLTALYSAWPEGVHGHLVFTKNIKEASELLIKHLGGVYVPQPSVTSSPGGRALP